VSDYNREVSLEPPLALRHPTRVLMVTAVSFIFLAAAIWLFGTVTLDQRALDAVVALATPGLVRVMKIINYGGDKLVLLPATLALYAAFPQSRRRWWIWLALMIAAPTAEGLTKLALARPRPEGHGFAFPSGHVTAAAAYFGAVFYLAGTIASTTRRRLVRVAAASAIVLVAIARVMLRAHWPSDTLAGAALGLALASVAALAATAQRRAEG